MRADTGYVSMRRPDGGWGSEVFERDFRLTAGVDRLRLPQFTFTNRERTRYISMDHLVGFGALFSGRLCKKFHKWAERGEDPPSLVTYVGWRNRSFTHSWVRRHVLFPCPG